MSLIKIPFKTGKLVDDGIDRKVLKDLEMEVPPYQYEGEIIVDFWVKSDVVVSIRPDKEDGGSLVDIGDDGLYESPLEPEEIAKLINEA